MHFVLLFMMHFVLLFMMHFRLMLVIRFMFYYHVWLSLNLYMFDFFVSSILILNIVNINIS